MGGRCGFCPLRFGTSLPPPLPLLELIYQKEAEERSGSSLISGNHHPSSLSDDDKKKLGSNCTNDCYHSIPPSDFLFKKLAEVRIAQDIISP